VPTPVIARVRAREVLDSRGSPTLEVDLELSDGTLGRSSVPSGASTGSHEARELRDGDARRYRGRGVLKAVFHVRDTIAPAVVGRSPFDQRELDALLLELDGTDDKSRLGANSLLAVSLAAARAAAGSSGIALWRRLGGDDSGGVLPLPMVNILSGGLHAENGLAFQDFLAIPVGAATYSQALETVSEVRSATADLLRERGLSTLKADEGGFGPPLASAEAALDLLVEAVRRARRSPCDEVALAVDVAASHFFDGESYRLPAAPTGVGAAEMIDLLERLVERYPIVSIEDGLAEDDWDGWARLTERLGSRVQLLGDDLFTTNSRRLARGAATAVANAVLVKMNQIGTLTETLDVIGQAREAGYATVVSARSGETEDDFLADLAVGTSAGQIKIGSLAQSERLAKYNRLVRIEEELGQAARFAGRAAVARSR
jgi:enolase